MDSKGTAVNASSAAQLIVRVKRRREDDPAETICLYDDNHSQQQESTSKRNKKSLVDEISRSMNINDGCPNPGAIPPPRKRLMLQRISTLDKFSYATIDQDTAMAITKKRSREACCGENHSNSTTDNMTVTNDGNNNKKRRVKLLVAQSKKTTSLATASTDQKTSCVIVDTMQLFDATTSSFSNTASNTNDQTNTIQSLPKGKILNSPTRLLAQAIVTAVSRNDFNDLSRALIQGADINYQLDNTHPTAGGFTALMAAAHRGNMRILKRLLLDSSLTCVRAKDTHGRTALDLLPKSTPRTIHEIQEMRQLLEQSVIRQHEALKSLENQRQQQKTQKAFAHHGESIFSHYVTSSNTHDAAGTFGEEYVVDIYLLQTSNDEDHIAHEQDQHMQEEENLANEMDADISNNNMFSILRVEGLRIDDETGQVELVAYDSDWSDLADDEEPDSNDERHYANDYPDESEEDNGGRVFAEVDDDEVDSDDDDYDDVGMGSKLHRRQQKRHQPKRSRNNQANPMGKMPAVTIQPSQCGGANDYGHKSVSFATTSYDMDVEDIEEPTRDDDIYGMDNDDVDGEDDEEDDIEMDLAKEINQFFGSSSGNGKGPDVTTLFDGHRNHVSRIMKPFQLSGERTGEDKKAGHTTESLQELWGIEGQPVRDNSKASDHEQRVEHMRERTGMVFAANAHEFDRETGLPKYGQELSDDEYDLIIQGYGRDTVVSKPSLDAVAYDSEYDRSD